MENSMYKEEVIEVDGLENEVNPVRRHVSYGGDIQGVFIIGSPE